MRARDRAVRAAMACLTDSEVRHLHSVSVVDGLHFRRPPGAPWRRIVVEFVVEHQGAQFGHGKLDEARLTLPDLNAALAAEGERAARAQRPA